MPPRAQRPPGGDELSEGSDCHCGLRCPQKASEVSDVLIHYEYTTRAQKSYEGSETIRGLRGRLGVLPEPSEVSSVLILPVLGLSSNQT